MNVIVRGIGKQILFEEDGDYRKYLYYIKKFSRDTDVKICAYCLMENHVHLLTHGDDEKVSLMMKKMGVGYARYFNEKYERVGHLFQDRYKSQPILNDVQLLNTFRYILMNPEKAGICRVSDYRWSSYRLYDNTPDYMDLELIRSLIGDRSRYHAMVTAPCDGDGMEFKVRARGDAWAIKMIRNSLNVNNGTELQNLEKSARDSALRLLKSKGLSTRQIERLTGINRNVVQRVSQ